MAQKTLAQLETELAQALAKIATLEGDNQKFAADLSERDSKIAGLEKALADSGKGKPPATSRDSSAEDEKEIRRRMSGGISRKHAEEAHAAQKAHDAAIKKAAAK